MTCLTYFATHTALEKFFKRKGFPHLVGRLIRKFFSLVNQVEMNVCETLVTCGMFSSTSQDCGVLTGDGEPADESDEIEQSLRLSAEKTDDSDAAVRA